MEDDGAFTDLEPVLRALDGIGLLLMSIDANLEEILDFLKGVDGAEEADA